MRAILLPHVLEFGCWSNARDLGIHVMCFGSGLKPGNYISSYIIFSHC
jgi:hypothetical protein